MKRVVVLLAVVLAGIITASAQTFAEIKAKAEHGDAKAQYDLGLMYYYGVNTDKDYAEAAKWYRKAAEQGDYIAQHILGSMYYNGSGVDQDYAEAVKWFRKPAEQGHAYSQTYLGECYHYGRGVTQDYNEAMNWYRKADRPGNAWAASRIKELEEEIARQKSATAEKTEKAAQDKEDDTLSDEELDDFFTSLAQHADEEADAYFEAAENNTGGVDITKFIWENPYETSSDSYYDSFEFGKNNRFTYFCVQYGYDDYEAQASGTYSYNNTTGEGTLKFDDSRTVFDFRTFINPHGNWDLYIDGWTEIKDRSGFFGGWEKD